MMYKTQLRNPYFVGFDIMDRFIDELHEVSAANSTYPPFNMYKHDENEYHLEFALAGVNEDDLSVTKDGNKLVISYEPKEGKDNSKYLVKNIANRSFKQTFALAEHIEVDSASMHNGLLVVKMKRVIPEELKPRSIFIERR